MEGALDFRFRLNSALAPQITEIVTRAFRPLTANGLSVKSRASLHRPAPEHIFSFYGLRSASVAEVLSTFFFEKETIPPFFSAFWSRSYGNSDSPSGRSRPLEPDGRRRQGYPALNAPFLQRILPFHATKWSTTGHERGKLKIYSPSGHGNMLWQSDHHTTPSMLLITYSRIICSCRRYIMTVQLLWRKFCKTLDEHPRVSTNHFTRLPVLRALRTDLLFLSF